MISLAWLKRGSFALLLGLVALLLQLWPVPVAARATGEGVGQPGNAAAIPTLSLSDTELTFALHTPTFAINEDGLLTAPGLTARTSQSGTPDLPFYTTYIALPPEANAAVTVEATAVSTQIVPTLRPVPTAIQPESHDDITLTTTVLEETLAYDAAFYSQDALYPTELYTLSEPMYLRDIRLVRLTLHPFRYNPAQNSLTHAQNLNVRVTFSGTDLTDLRPVLAYQDRYLAMAQGLVLNASQIDAWRSLPRGLNSTPTALPVGQTAYKIAVSQDAIHEVTYGDLGITGSYPSSSIQMLHGGQAVAFQYIDGGNNSSLFDHANDKVRFYGWAFDGSRHDKQYVTDNIFWLWVGGTASSIATTASQNGFPTASSFSESITHEQDNRFSSTFVAQELWTENEPDSWYWELYTKSSVPVTKTYTVGIPNPVTSGGTITFTAEVLSRGNSTHLINSYLNYGTHGSAYQGTRTWANNLDVNIVGTAPASALVNGINQITVGTHSPGTATRSYFFNRVTIDYQRQFVAVNDQLLFGYSSGSHQYSIQGYTQNNPSNIFIWNITNPYQPLQVTGSVVSGSGPYTYTFGSSNPAEARFIATTNTNIVDIAAADVNSYFVTNIDPTTGEVDWLAVSYADFLPAANQLATHRQNALYGGYRTHVVDIQHIINQYGYGLETPSALHDYLAHALADWQVAPSYVVLFGDASADVRHIWIGNGAPTYWDANQISFVNTDFLFVDRFQGLIPTDHSFVLLAGSDSLADMAIGRLPVQTNTEATTVVNKIIQYEQNHLAYLTNSAGYQWLSHILFAADDYDPNAGDFCYENEVTANLLPGTFNTQEMCLLIDYPTTTDMRNAMKQEINTNGISLLNYRGHGGIDNWAGTLLSTAVTDFWDNAGKPIVSLSMDCLDSHFIYPGFEGLGETVVGQPVSTTGNVGAAAHWSSTGLGLTYEHNFLARGFYEGLFEMGLTAIGDAITYGKLDYWQAGMHYSELYSFTLHGDPAMQLFRPALSLDMTAQPAAVMPGATITYTITVENSGLYPSQITVTDELPVGLSFISHSATVTSTVSVVGDEVTISLEPPFAPGDSANITLTTVLDPGYTGSALLLNAATVSGTGLEGAPGDETDTAQVLVTFPNSNTGVFLPLLIK